jgi:hypothetical protein
MEIYDLDSHSQSFLEDSNISDQLGLIKLNNEPHTSKKVKTSGEEEDQCVAICQEEHVVPLQNAVKKSTNNELVALSAMTRCKICRDPASGIHYGVIYYQ